jgi:hypothetical protein
MTNAAKNALRLLTVSTIALVCMLAASRPAAAKGGGGGGGGNPPTTTLPTLSSVTFAPATVAGGAPATGTVRFASITDGAVVSLSSSSATVSVPTEMVVSGGQSSGAFAVTTSAVTAPMSVVVTATAFGVTRTGTITLTPAAAPPASDVVRIQRAEWSAGLLRIEASSTNSNAILSVYLTVNNSFMFTLTNAGGGKFTDQRGFVFNPESVTVRSNFGGSATHTT